MLFHIEKNLNNFKNRNKYSNDIYLKKLVDLSMINHSVPGLNIFIRYMFYSLNEDEYTSQLYLMNNSYPTSMEELTKVYNIFIEWKPYEKYNMGEIRGVFLEFLTYAIIEKEFIDYDIYRESNVILSNYKSHTWDVIVDLINYLNLYECKFSFESFKRKHLDQIVALMNKLEGSNSFVVFFQYKQKILLILDTLQNDTSDEKFKVMLSKINIISLEDFINGTLFEE